MKKPFLTLFCVLILCSTAFAEDIYIAQTEQGEGAGTSCAEAESAAWFNTAANWGGGAGEIDAGDTAYLCDDGGDFTTRLATQLTGSDGNRITITEGSGETVTMTDGITISHDYITVDSITLITNAVDCGSSTGRTSVRVTGDHVTVSNNIITGGAANTLQYTQTADYGIITGNTIHDFYMNAINLQSTTGYHVVSYNEIYTGYCSECSGYEGDCNGIGYVGEDIIFEGNYIHDLITEENGGTVCNTSHTDASQCYNDTGDPDCLNITFRYNLIWLEGCYSYANGQYTKGWETGGGIDGLMVYGNIIRSFTGLHSGGDKSNNFTIINNSFIGYDDPDCGGNETGIYVDLTTGGTNTIKNNIFIDWAENHVNYDDPEPTSGYNLTYNFDESTPDCSDSNADCQQTGDQHGVDPLFTAFGDDDFTLSSISPAKGGGVDLGNGLLYGLDPTSTWPDNVKPLDQDLYGDWEIGAFIYGPRRGMAFGGY